MEIATTPFYQAGNLGEGGFGSVVTLFDEHGSIFAGKTFAASDSDASDSGSSERDAPSLGLDTGALRELAFLSAQGSMGLSHPNVLAGTCVTWLNGEVCVVLPKLVRSLEDVIAKNEWLSNADRLKVVKQVLSALVWMHDKGFMHRDVKPANVLLDDADNASVCDFSLVKLISMAEAEPTGGRCTTAGRATHTRWSGTATYTAPEVVDGCDYGVKADAYSAGVLMYELLNNAMLSAKNDKQGLSELEAVRARLSRAKLVPRVMAGLLDPSPETRLSCAEALAALEGREVTGTEGVPVGRVAASGSLDKDVKRACEAIGCQLPAVEHAASRLRSATGAHPAQCAFLAHKVLDVELVDGWDLVEGELVEGLDAGYPQAELAMLEVIKFDIYGVVC